MNLLIPNLGTTSLKYQILEMLRLDRAKNESGSGDRVVPADDSRVTVLALATNEELIVARRAYRLLSRRGV